MHISTRLAQGQKILFIALLSVVILSCEKKKCGDPSNVTIDTNSPVVKGWDLHLETVSVAGGRYVWSGPNGWKVEYNSIASDANQQDIPSVTAQATGEYKVQVFNFDGCLVNEGKTTVSVIDAPAAPCTITANSSQSSVIGVGNYNFVSRSFTISSSFFLVNGSASLGGGSDYMRFGFSGQTRPKPGIYDITGGYFGTEYGTVGLFIQSGVYQFVAQGGKAYVTAGANGKLSVSVCGIRFSNPINPATPITVSANITEP